MTDQELIVRYAADRSDDCFAELTSRYIRLVYSSCRRQLGDGHAAEDAAQMVFELLSRKAGALGHAQLGGWLVTASHHVCSNLKRADHRRQRRETGAAMNADLAGGMAGGERSGGDSELLEVLDEALTQLGPADRDALAIRYLQEQPLSEVGRRLGLSDDAARKRVQRALERLRAYLQSRGINAETAALSGILAGPGHLPADPAGLARRMVDAARSAGGSGAAGGTGASPMWGAGKMAAMAGAVVAAAAGVWGIYGSMTAAAQRPGAAGAAAPVVQLAAAAVDSPNALPATAPAAYDQSTPDATLASMARAMRDGERDAVDGCFLDSPHKPLTAVEASLEMMYAAEHLTAAGKKAYGDRVSEFHLGFPPTAVVEAIVVLRRARGLSAPVDGDKAQMLIEIPPAVMRIVPEEARDVVGGWQAKPLYFVLRDGKWRLDARRSMKFAMKIQHKLNGKLVSPPEATIAEISLAAAGAYDQVAREVSAGNFPNVADAVDELRAVMNQQVWSRYSIVGMSTGLVPADGDVR